MRLLFASEFSINTSKAQAEPNDKLNLKIKKKKRILFLDTLPIHWEETMPWWARARESHWLLSSLSTDFSALPSIVARGGIDASNY